MKATFNLVSNPWIPCTLGSGETIELSLFDTLVKAHELQTVEGDSPQEKAAILRLLLAILHRVVDTQTQESWHRTWQAGKFDATAIEAYFHKWENRFDLFDPIRPFYQIRHDLVEPKPAIKMRPGLLSVPHYYHSVVTGEESFTPAQAARLIVNTHAFATPGICHPQKGLFFNGGPWLAGKVFFLEGDTLFHTLMLNLLQYAPDHPHPNLCKTEADAPAWEMDDPFLNNREYPLGYLDYLTWQNRRAYLIPIEKDGQIWVEQVVEAPGLKLKGEIRDPMKVYVDDDHRGRKMMYLTESKALWRDSSTFLDIKSQKVHVPLALRWISDLVYENDLPTSLTLRLMSVGLVVENQSKIVLHRLERMPLPIQFLSDQDLVAVIKQEIALAESVQSKIYFATNTLAKLILSQQADLSEGREPLKEDVKGLMMHWKWEQAYWPKLELPFFTLIQELANGNSEATKTWRETLIRTAWSTLDSSIRFAGDNTSALKAAVQARRELGGGLKALGLSFEAQKSPELIS